MSEQESQNEHMESGNETSSSQPSSSETSTSSSQSAYAGRSNMRSRWKRKSGEPAAKPSSPQEQFSYGAISSLADVTETVSGKDAFSRPVVSNEKTEVAAVIETPATEESCQLNTSCSISESSRPSFGSAHPSFEPRRIERTRRQEKTDLDEASETQETFTSNKKSHERFEDYQPDANGSGTEDYTLDYSKHAATKRPQKTQTSQHSGKFGKGNLESSSSQKFEKTEQKDRFQSQSRSYEKPQHSAPKKGLLGKIGGFFASMLGKKTENKQQGEKTDEKSWQKRSRHEGSGKSSQGGNRSSRHHNKRSTGGESGGAGGSGSRSKGGFNRNSRGRGGSIKG